MTNNTINTVSNADVVSIRGRAAVMRQAWFLIKSVGVQSLSTALKQAWTNLRAAIALDMKLAPVKTAWVKTVKLSRAKTAANIAGRKAAYTGDTSSRSPLNPFAQRCDLTGFTGRACIATQLGR